MALSNALNTALEQPSVRMFNCMQISLPSHDINLMDGDGFVTFSSNGIVSIPTTTFTSSDPIFGIVTAVDKIAEAVATQAPTYTITLSPASTAGLAYLANSYNQGCQVTFWTGTCDPVTGVVQGVEEQFVGKIDFVTVEADASSITAKINIISGMERLFAKQEGITLCAQWYQSIFPTSTAFNQCQQSAQAVFWGGQTPIAQFPIVVTPPSVNDRLAGINNGSTGTGISWGPS